MEHAKTHILTINAGSSSIKFDFFEANGKRTRILQGAVEKIGWPSANFYVTSEGGRFRVNQPAKAASHLEALDLVIGWLRTSLQGQQLSAIGHRIVHGGPKYFAPQIINDEILAELKHLISLDPEHLPIQIKLIEALSGIFPTVRQIACFDTAFHHDLPDNARLLPIPRQYEMQGLRRYGFHGLSCAYVMRELGNQAGEHAPLGRVIIAHLGNGVSLTAVQDGKSVDTTMSLTPASGVPMSTRSGDIDPGLAVYLTRTGQMSPERFSELVNFKSGLLGLSGLSGDMKELLAEESKNENARQAIELFCYQVKKSIGALSVAMGGIDTLVFTGGMGEKAPRIRAEICEGVEFLGIEIDPEANKQSAELVSSQASRVHVRVIKTDEAMIIAEQAEHLIRTSGAV